jgi:2-dehydro-3-deoxyphosphooctonate aldolase (KDO 8-P synthase)
MAWSFGQTPFLIAGPCVVEPGDVLPRVAEVLARFAAERGVAVCFKASFDKANRARGGSSRGPGLDEGLRALERVRQASGLPVLTDIHLPEQAGPVAEVVDALQIPAFLCRQTDLLEAAGRTGRPVNVKKGQWMSAEAMAGAVEKVRHAGSRDVAVTERGTFFGYGDLVVDMRNFDRLRAAAAVPAIFDATHAVQRPGQGVGGSSGGDRDHVPALLAAAAVAGADGFFLETHPDPARALSDAATQWPLDRLAELLDRTLDLWARSRAAVIPSAARELPARDSKPGRVDPSLRSG